MRTWWLLGVLLLPRLAGAAGPWPAEAHTRALKLTHLDPAFARNMSGACWNPSNRTFWVCCNGPGLFWALVADGAGGWRIAANAAGVKARWAADGDLEGICQRDFTQPLVYLMDENGFIKEFDVAEFGVTKLRRQWDIRAWCPQVNGRGPEAITFVPDEWLRRQGFRNAAGQRCVSTNGMRGVMLVGSQIGGCVHAFDLNATNSTCTYLGSNLTARAETADLDFDRAAGRLYIWHNLGPNDLEVATLNSTLQGRQRKLHTVAEYRGPRPGNLEGFALGPGGLCLITDDDNAGNEGVVIYRHFKR